MNETPRIPLVLRRADADQAGCTRFLARGCSVHREQEQALNRHAASSDPPLVLTGPGTTTSALLAAWSSRHAAQHPDRPMFVHHVGCTRESRDPAHLLRRLLSWIRDQCGLREPIPVSAEARVEILPNWLARLAARGQAVIALDRPDALDDQDAAEAMSWLPDWLPAGIRLVIGVSPGAAAEMLGARGWTIAAVGEREEEPMPGPAAVAAGTGQLLAALWCARRGLTRQQLEGLVPAVDVDEVLTQTGSWLYEVDGRLALTGPDVRDAVRRTWLTHGGDRQALERQLADHFRDSVSPDALDARPWLLARSGDWGALADMLGDPVCLGVMLGDDWCDELLDCWQAWGTADELARFYADRIRRWPEGADGRLVLQLLRTLRELPGEFDPEPLLAQAAHRLEPADAGGQAALRALRSAWLADAGRGAEAEPLLREVLAEQERNPGPDHPETRATRHRLAMLLEETGQGEAAAELYRTALGHRETTLDGSHPELIPHLVNLAAVLRAGNALEEAGPLYRRALKIAERQFGSNHPQTAACLDSLAGLLYAGHDFEQAEVHYQRALGIAEAAFGPRHPATAASAHNLGTVMDAREQFQAAEMLFRRALDIRMAVLGEDHVDTASSLHNLAGALDAMGRRDEAEPLYRQAVAVWERVVGAEHPATATSINNLADVLRDKGELAEAEALYRRNLDTWTRLLGDGHPHAVMTRSELAMLAADSGPPAEAERLLRDAADQTAAVMGPDSMQHINTVVRYAALLRDTRRRDEARNLLRQTLEQAQDSVSVLSPRIQKLRRHLEALDQDPDRLH